MTTVRRVGEEEWRSWREIRLAALKDAPGAFNSKLTDWQGGGDSEQRWRQRLSSVPYNALAKDGERAVGMVSGAKGEDPQAVELISMWVAPDRRGAGVGDALIGAVVDWARTHGARRLVLQVIFGNERALSLYRRNGFVDGRTLEGNGSPCELEMERSL